MALPDVVIIGAGVVGAACAFYAAHAGLSVVVLDRGPIAGGATSVGQGSALASDKTPGPALELAVESLRRWEELGADLGPGRLGLARPGALAVAVTAAQWKALTALADRQHAAGIEAERVPADALPDHEPLLSANLAGGVHYPGDLRVDGVLATAQLLRASGAEVRCGVDVRGIELTNGQRVTGVRTAGGERIGCAAVVNAAGVWAGEVSAMVGTPLPITPHRGFVLVTEALGAARAERRAQPPRGGVPGGWVARPIRHTVYAPAAEPGSDPSTVVTTGRAGTVLIGAAWRRVGAERSWPVPVLRELATGAVALFPPLGEVCVLRANRGFQPGTPDHLPIIGPDLWITGLYHAAGHSGSGIGLAPATGALITKMITSEAVPPEPLAFHPERFG